LRVLISYLMYANLSKCWACFLWHEIQDGRQK